MSPCSLIYQKHRQPGHPVQMYVTALIISRLCTCYPNAWERRKERKRLDERKKDGIDLLLPHIKNLDRRQA